MKRENETVRNIRNNNGNKNNYQQGNQCQKPGHNHEWKHCPNNPRNKNINENNRNERHNNSIDEHEIEYREFNMVEEMEDTHLIQYEE